MSLLKLFWIFWKKINIKYHQTGKTVEKMHVELFYFFPYRLVGHTPVHIIWIFDKYITNGYLLMSWYASYFLKSDIKTGYTHWIDVVNLFYANKWKWACWNTYIYCYLQWKTRGSWMNSDIFMTRCKLVHQLTPVFVSGNSAKVSFNQSSNLMLH